MIVSKGSQVGVKIWLKWTKYSDQTNFEPKVLYERNQGLWNILGPGSVDPNIWVLLPFLDPNIRTLLWWKYIKDIMWLAWQTWMTQPGKFNLQLQSPPWNFNPNIRIGLDPKKMVQYNVYTPKCGVTYQGQKVVQVDPHFGVQWLIQYLWCHFQVQTKIFGSNMNLNPLIQLGLGVFLRKPN